MYRYICQYFLQLITLILAIKTIGIKIHKTTTETIPHFPACCSAKFGPQTAKSFFMF